jgi:myo-inositol-1(or 4)-monophosphatase
MNLQQITHRVCEIAIETGKFILQERAKFSSEYVEEKSKNSLVSYVDKEAEQRIINALSKLIPDAGFMGEEGINNTLRKTYTWIIDPLDGTTNFIHGVPCYAVSIALMHENQPISGVVYEINLNECFYAWQNGGAYLNNKSIQVSTTQQLSQSLLATGFPYYNYQKLEEYLRLFKHLLQACRGVRRPGSAATDLAYVACGRFDGFYEYSLQPWDVAAGIILVKEAGGKLCDFKGENNFLFGEEIIATNPFIFNELKDLIKNYMYKN